MRSFFALPLLAASAAASPPQTFDVRTFICPVGGKSFKQDVGYSAFPLITLPDGSWMGDHEIGAQVPVCPDNGLVLLPDLAASAKMSGRLAYSGYTPVERDRLPALIADAEYRALKTDGRYAQAAWLAEKLGLPGEVLFFTLQRATWATRDPMLRRKLVERFVDKAPVAIDAAEVPESTRRFWRAYVVNGLRELGRFAEASAMLDLLEASGPPVPGAPDPDSIFGPEAIGPALRRAIEQKDDGRYPAELLHRKILADICEERMPALFGATGAATKAACNVRREREAKEFGDDPPTTLETFDIPDNKS